MIQFSAPFLFVFLVSCNISYGQIDAVEPDSVLDKYYINYPIDTGAEYSIGDTLAAVYSEERSVWEDFCVWAIGHTLFTEQKPEYVVRAILIDTSEYLGGNGRFICGLKLSIYSIEKHDGDTVVYLDEYPKPYSECKLEVGSEKWYDIYDWVNVSGRYRIKKSTDNYRVGDTVYRYLYKEPTMVGGIFKHQRANYYFLSAIVRDIDTSDEQRLLLEFIQIAHSYYQGHFWNPSKGKMVQDYPEEMQYNYVTVHINDKVWTKPYRWFKTGQYWQVNNGNGVPEFIGKVRWGCIHMLFYDCEGKRFKFEP